MDPYRTKGISEADELLSKTLELHEANRSLVLANKRLLSKTTELHEANRSLFESNHELAEVNKELADTNKRFAQTNKHFAGLNKELTLVTKELALSNKIIEQQKESQLEFINIAAHELRTPIIGNADNRRARIIGRKTIANTTREKNTSRNQAGYPYD